MSLQRTFLSEMYSEIRNEEQERRRKRRQSAKRGQRLILTFSGWW